ncbi:FKBP-type peptidyl-prolyl cis-trans isomerase FkpA [Chitinophaga jiangningensis]|uniref:Peptidyl-prolyl cis-trans isomerase n=1 Tax=Chitinophaga jiangningensis TaxID=1419482 RepID=A0A1M6YN80_9BACT|nr:FKBP-type peptidyl-prolyl cis-trans isomerase [Chitinophaga jiangningensis]SHL19590.1 FKBP-type peptidyl-prolyl cis-trans isomerase FkpA [Chitinophaga jiangningensis]
MKKILILGLAIIGILTACKKDSQEDNYDQRAQYVIDSTKIAAYLTANNITNVIKDTTGVVIEIKQQGTGNDTIRWTSYPTVGYAGYLMNGTQLGAKFDGSDSTNFDLQLQMNRLIPGWYIGLRYVRKGGTARLYIPSYLAYGNQSQPKIPANSVLIFDIKLFDFSVGN